MPNHICDVHNCSEPANWKMEMTGHPKVKDNYLAFYSKEHRFIPTWAESQKQYKIEVTRPLNVPQASNRR